MLNPFDHPICFAVPERLVESAWHEHVPFAMFLVDILRPKTIVELGTHYGESYCAFCQAVKQLNLDTRCFAIDTWRGDPHASFYGPEVLADLRAHHDPKYGSFSSLIQGTFDEALPHFEDGSINLLHIDAYHVYEAVKRDFETWLPKMSSDGVILFHDTNVRERDFGVSLFWDEIKRHYRHFEFLHGHGLGVLALGKVRSRELQDLMNATGEQAAMIREFFFQLGNRLVLRFQNECKDRRIGELNAEALNAVEAERDRENQRTQAFEETVRSLSADLASRQEEIVTLQHRLEAREQAIEALSTQLDEKHRMISALNEQSVEGEKHTQIWKARVTEVEDTVTALSAEVAAKNQSIEALVSKTKEEEQRIQTLADRVADQRAQLVRINNTLGWRLLSIYGSRVKYPYLLPLYRFYGRIKYAYLLPIYKRLGLMPSTNSQGTLDVPASEIVSTAKPLLRSYQFRVVDRVRPISALQPHSLKADVIICVHNALEDVKRCLESVVRHTTMPYSLILVDDGSDQETKNYLSSFATSQGAALIRNENARGYTFAANQGMQQSASDYLVLLNSDTVVTKDWLDRLIACGESDPKIGLVGPLSNSATWQSIPEIIIDGSFAENELPTGKTVADLGDLVTQNSARLYPRLPFLNGFCLMIKRQLIDEIGYFDEEAFGRGYGEENDYCLRARIAGWKAAVADDAYVHHLQSRSYSHERRKELWVHAGKALAEKHGERVIEDGVASCRYDRVLEGVRARSRVMVERQRLIEAGSGQWKDKRVLFVLPVSMPGGGSNVVLDEAEAMRKMGVDATILNFSKYKKGFEQSYPDVVLPVRYVAGETELTKILCDYDAVIATWCASVEWLVSNNSGSNSPLRGYYIQDFEPYFFTEGSPEFKIAWNSYTRFADLIRVTKTEWNRATVWSEIGVESIVIGPSVNIDLYRPRNQRPVSGQRPLKIAAMIRPSSPRRAPRETLEILKELQSLYRDAVEVNLFGCDPDDLRGFRETSNFSFNLGGVLTRPQIANLLDETDIFVDFSTYQAMGLTAMEAMACGAAVIVPKRGGSSSFVKHEENAVVVDTNSAKACFSALQRVVEDEEFRIRLQRKALVDICQFFPERSAYNILEAFFNEAGNEKPLVDSL